MSGADAQHPNPGSLHADAQHPGPGSLHADEVHLWFMPLTSATSALRSVLAGYLGVGADAVPLTRTPAGKPCLAGGAAPAFNLSHSGALLVIAVSARESVGVDVEQLKGRSRETLIERVLAPQEAATVWACAPAERERAFLRHWTAKEACLKAWGSGLVGDLRELPIAGALGQPSLAGAAPARPEADSAIQADSTTQLQAQARFPLQLQRFDPCAGYVGTVAVSGGPWRAVPVALAQDYLG